MNNPIVYDYKGNEIMPTLVYENEKGVDITTSLIVAQVFGKEHKHVLRDIDSLSCSELFRQSNFGLSFKNRELPNGGGTWMHEDEGNKLLFSIAYLKKLRNFAVSYIIEGKRKPAKYETAGIFYACKFVAIKIAAVTPVWNYNGTTAFDRCRTTGKDSRFSVYNA